MKIGIVNDLPIAGELLRRIIRMTPQHEVLWSARSGAEAVLLAQTRRPDLILMDLVMPEMDGVEATRQIMATAPCAILVVTASVDSNVGQVFEAMGHGAIDAVDIPSESGGDLRTGARALLGKIDAIGTLLGDRSVARPQPRRPGNRLVAIGASAGGPAALAAILRELPEEFPAAIVIIQHVDAHFAPGMAAWLADQCKLPVRLAEPGDRLESGTVLQAGTGDHLVLRSDATLAYTPEPRNYAYRPSIDVFFKSVCAHWHGEATGILLTGMGRDGATGLKALRDRRHFTIAQDAASCAVYGMPKAAIAIGAAAAILPPERIAHWLIDTFRPASKKG